MMWKAKWSQCTERICRKSLIGRKSRIAIAFVLVILLITFFFNSENYSAYENLPYPSFKSFVTYVNEVNNDKVDGYLVYNSKCRMLSIKPLDPSIKRFIWKEKFEACSKAPLMTSISTLENGSTVLNLDRKFYKLHRKAVCCWAPIFRPEVTKPTNTDFDSKVTIEKCESFKEEVLLPPEVEILMVSCKENVKVNGKVKKKGKENSSKTIYENIHAILDPEKVRERLQENTSTSDLTNNSTKKLSILFLGIDSVSRLNFQRTMPKTEDYLMRNEWIAMRGYNKMGENTFPNLMAILTGQSQQQSYTKCAPTIPFKLDHCPFLWHNFRNIGYVTAYGEDETALNTFNYLKVGFVHPPTDYYLRPYILATDRLLKTKKRFSGKYCTGPELSFERIFDYAMRFSVAFLGSPYFGFFWTNTVSHDTLNGPSSIDQRMLGKLKWLEEKGVTRDAMIIFLSDHGMRYGDVRNTFVGWYEERLPFLFISIPKWFKDVYPDAYDALKLNQNRLTSPYDLYMTLRDIVERSRGEAEASSGCSTCQSFFTPIPKVRGCEEAGVSPHWCTCVTFKAIPIGDSVVSGAIQSFLDHVETIVEKYKDKKGKRLCAKLKLKRVHRASKVFDFPAEEVNEGNRTSILQTGQKYFFMIEVSPGNGKFEATVKYNGPGNFTVKDDQISRITTYANSARCLHHGSKHFCHCVK
ncbi:uncharacterized protein [Prorops nasuta]|uniref:uncharacterized protein n=1 Tax=Prorops nasuta TaxID=863751 RepID=UPI0034CF737E